MSGLVTMHVWRVPARRIPSALAATAFDPRRVRALRDARFAKLLGTSRGFGPRGADLTRWALLASWESADAAGAFCDSALVRRWQARARTSWSATMVPLASRGSWSRRAPFGGVGSFEGIGSLEDVGSFGGVGSFEDGRSDWDGPVAALTHSRLALRRSVAFWRAVPPVAADLARRSGLHAAFGVAEVPLGVAGTFSLWRDVAALREFAYRGAAHREAIRQTALRGWYAEELFTRFGVLRTRGSLGTADDGADDGGAAQ